MTKNTSATYFLLLATIFWGMTFALIRDAVATLSIADFIFWRFIIASLFLLIFFHSAIQFTNKKLIIEGIVLGIFFGGGAVAQTFALASTNAATVSFITSFEVLIVPLIISLVNWRWPRLTVIFAIILTITGMALITLTSDGFDISSGNWWALLCAFCFAIYTISAGKFSQSRNPMTLTFIQAATLSLIAVLVNFSRLQPIAIPKHANQWIAIIFCAIFASVLSFYLQIRFQRFVSATKTAMIFASEPIFATITAFFYLNESISSKFVFGAILIFCGILLSEYKVKYYTVAED